MATHAAAHPLWTRRNAVIAAAPLVVAFLAGLTFGEGSRDASTYTSAPVEIELTEPAPTNNIDPAALVGVHHLGGTGARIVLDASGRATSCDGRIERRGTWTLEGDTVVVSDTVTTTRFDARELAASLRERSAL